MASPSLAHGLRVVIEDAIRHPRAWTGIYNSEITRLLQATRPPEFAIEAIAAADSGDGLRRVLTELPGLSGFQTSFLGPRLLRAVWASGVPLPVGYGMTHATSLFAPTIPHDLANDPGSHLVVTMNEMSPWARPRRSWADLGESALLRRAWRHADAIIVATEAMAESLVEAQNFGQRVHVIPPPISSALWEMSDGERADRARRAPAHTPHVVTSWVSAAAVDVEGVLGAWSRAARPDTELVVILETDDQRLKKRVDATIVPSNVRFLRGASAAERAHLVLTAHAVLETSLCEIRPQAVVDAMFVGTPLIVADTPGLCELAGEAALVVPRASATTLDGETLTAHLSVVTGTSPHDSTRRQIGLDQSQAFEPQDIARRLWRLHGDLASY